jgi:hypothetical protein
VRVRYALTSRRFLTVVLRETVLVLAALMLCAAVGDHGVTEIVHCLPTFALLAMFGGLFHRHLPRNRMLRFLLCAVAIALLHE